MILLLINLILAMTVSEKANNMKYSTAYRKKLSTIMCTQMLASCATNLEMLSNGVNKILRRTPLANVFGQTYLVGS